MRVEGWISILRATLSRRPRRTQRSSPGSLAKNRTSCLSGSNVGPGRTLVIRRADPGLDLRSEKTMTPKARVLRLNGPGVGKKERRQAG